MALPSKAKAMIRGMTIIEAENVDHGEVEFQMKKKEAYKEALERQMLEKKAKVEEEKKKKMQEDIEEDTRIKKEIEIQNRKLQEQKDKELKRKQEDMERAQEAVRLKQLEKDKEKEKIKEANNREREKDRNMYPTPEAKKKLHGETENENFQEMIKTNQDWMINTKLSKEYVLHERREAGNLNPVYRPQQNAPNPYIQNDNTSNGFSRAQKVHQEMDVLRSRLMEQLNTVKAEAMEAISRRDKAEKKLQSSRQMLFEKQEEEKYYKEQLERALLNTNPDQQYTDSSMSGIKDSRKPPIHPGKQHGSNKMEL